MHIVKTAPAPVAVKEETEYVVLTAPKDVNAVVHEEVHYQVYDGVVRVPKDMVEELTTKHGFKASASAETGVESGTIS